MPPLYQLRERRKRRAPLGQLRTGICMVRSAMEHRSSRAGRRRIRQCTLEVGLLFVETKNSRLCGSGVLISYPKSKLHYLPCSCVYTWHTACFFFFYINIQKQCQVDGEKLNGRSRTLKTTHSAQNTTHACHCWIDRDGESKYEALFCRHRRPTDLYWHVCDIQGCFQPRDEHLHLRLLSPGSWLPHLVAYSSSTKVCNNPSLSIYISIYRSWII